jgi:3-hydroxyisobutyrate dehydrogenase
MLKDLTTAVELARETSTPAIFSATCRELWVAAQSRLEKDVDHTDVVRWLEEMAKTELK